MNGALVAADQPDIAPADNLATTRTQVGGSDLSVTALGSASIGGTELVIKHVFNVGPEPATDATLSLTLPPTFELDSFVAVQGAADCSGVGQVVSCELGTVAVGATTKLELTATAVQPPGSSVMTGATVGSSSVDWLPLNDSVTVVVPIPAVVSIGDASAYEGDTGGARLIRFPVTLSQQLVNQTVTVNYKIVPGGASGGVGGDIDDRLGKAGSITFKPPANSAFTVPIKFVTVKVNPDLSSEGDETFSVVLSNPNGAVIGDAIGAGTVLDDDPGVGQRVGIGDASVREGDAGQAKVSVVVTLSQPASGTVTALVSTGGGSAVTGVDYKAVAKNIMFKSGQQTKVVTITLYPDLIADGDRTIQLTLSNVVGATVLGSGVGTITILDDD